MSADTNADAVCAWLLAYVDSFDFLRVGADQSLGRDLANTQVERIHDRGMVDHAGPDGQWLENKEKYAAWKEKRYGVHAPSQNVRTGDMLSKKKLKGQTRVEPKIVTLVYGDGTVPAHTTTGEPLPMRKHRDGSLSPIDDKTDHERAYFAHTGQSKRNIVRKFYGFGPGDPEAIAEVAQESLNEMIRDTNAAHGF